MHSLYSSSLKLSHVVDGREREVGASDQPQGVLSQNWGGTEPNRTVICMGLKPTTNDKHKSLAPCPDFGDLDLTLPISKQNSSVAVKSMRSGSNRFRTCVKEINYLKGQSHGCLKMSIALAAEDTPNRRRAASPLVRLAGGGGKKWEATGCSQLKLGLDQDKSYCHLYDAKSYD
ncbi:hypothetical protein TNCV_1908101 [Trichonephila clavipes]|nr:hypothetical protein TNCV_1908101 [Trichonephila clavipes]